MTQDELLAEAARTELDNLRDLEQMVALEEATRKKAMYKRSKYSGPMIRFHSKKVEDVGLVGISFSCFNRNACFSTVVKAFFPLNLSLVTDISAERVLPRN